MKERRRCMVPVARLFCFFAFSLNFFCLLGQEFHIKTFTSKDGLSSSYILSTYQDKLGYLWISTPSGLNRFDGKYFVNYGFNEGLPDVRSFIVMMDQNLRLWVGTPRGITELRGAKFINYPLSDSLKINYTYGLIETKKRKIRALTSAGVYEYRNSVWWKIGLYPGYENHACRGIIETNEGNYINYGNLLVLQKNDGSCKIIGQSKRDEIYYNNLSQSGGEILISTINGLCSIKNEQLIKFPGELGKLKDLYTYFYDSKKRFWIASESMGLQLIESGDTTHFRLIYKRPLISLISHISEDNDGNIWVADYEGLVRITEMGYKIYSSPEINNTHAIRNIFQPPAGPFLVNNGTLTLQAFQNGIFTEKKLKLETNSILPNNELLIDKYAFDDKNRYWYYLRGFALAVQEDNRIFEQSKKLSPLGDQVFDVLFDNYRKKIIVAVRTQKFPCQYNDSAYSLLPVANNIEVPGNIMNLHQCTNGIILFANDRGAIYSIDKQNICKLQLNEFNSTGSIAGFCNDPSGDIWIIYHGRGLRRYCWQNGLLLFKEEIKKTNGLPNDYIYGECFDNSGNLWVATSAGIAILAKTRENSYKIIRSFYASDLRFENGEAIKLAKDSYGNIWLSSLQNLIRFDPNKIINYSSPIPAIQIENIKLNLEQTAWSLYSDSLSGIFQLPTDPRLPYYKNTLGIYFKGISSSGTDGIKYSYKLEGLDTTWSPASSENFVSFVNLPSRGYVFKVKAQLLTTRWSNPAVFAFEIKKAFWETWSFRLFIILIGAALIVIIFRYRLNQLKARTEMQNELHKLETKAFKLQMNPHFIHNALNSIQSLVINNKNNEASHYINKFAKLLRQVLENSDKNLISLDKELYSLQLYIDLERLRMDMNVDYDVRLNEALPDSEIKIPPLILQPFVENALWHGLSRKEGDKKILLTIDSRPGWIICQITDNGIGRKKAAESYETFPEGHLSKAVNIIRQRLTDFNQSPGTEPISFIDLEKNGEATGTTVIVRIKTSFTD